MQKPSVVSRVDTVMMLSGTFHLVMIGSFPIAMFISEDAANKHCAVLIEAFETKDTQLAINKIEALGYLGPVAIDIFEAFRTYETPEGVDVTLQ